MELDNEANDDQDLHIVNESHSQGDNLRKLLSDPDFVQRVGRGGHTWTVLDQAAKNFTEPIKTLAEIKEELDSLGTLFLESLNEQARIEDVRNEITQIREELDNAKKNIDGVITWAEDTQALMLRISRSQSHEARISELERWREIIVTRETNQRELSLSAQRNWIAMLAFLIALVSVSCSAVVGIFTILNILGLLSP